MKIATDDTLQGKIWHEAYRAWKSRDDWDEGSIAVTTPEVCAECGERNFFVDVHPCNEWTEDGLLIAEGLVRCETNYWSDCLSQHRRWTVNVSAQGGYAMASVSVEGSFGALMAVDASDIRELIVQRRSVF
jgi:hypothetical protein